MPHPTTPHKRTHQPKRSAIGPWRPGLPSQNAAVTALVVRFVVSRVVSRECVHAQHRSTHMFTKKKSKNSIEPLRAYLASLESKTRNRTNNERTNEPTNEPTTAEEACERERTKETRVKESLTASSNKVTSKQSKSNAWPRVDGMDGGQPPRRTLPSARNSPLGRKLT